MRFISFEGLDGAGKSTLIRGLWTELIQRGLKVRVTREPGGTALGDEIRELILRTSVPPAPTPQSHGLAAREAPTSETELLLYEASRAQHVAKVIKPSLALGEWVLCDRYSESSIAFQCFGRGLERQDVEMLNRYAEQGLRPELIVLLDLSVDASRRRQDRRAADDAAQKADRIESEADDFHERVREGFLTQARAEPTRWLVLNAEDEAAKLLRHVMDELARRGWIADGPAQRR